MTQESYVVLDIETQDSFQAVGSFDASKLHVSVVGIYQSSSDITRCFQESELAEFWPILEAADRVVGFNLDGFDYPVLGKYYHGNFRNIPTLDILTEFKKDHGFRIKLDSLALSSLGVGKSGDGLQAIRLWEQGKIDELMQYCLDDVTLTRDLFVRGRDEGVLYYSDHGQKTSWMVDWHLKQSEVPLSLPC